MPKMKWTQPSAETIAYFERIAPGPPIQPRRMFGMPARFLNGHMLVAVFGNAFMLHLSQEDREECIRAGAKPFAPMGREAKEYVEITPGHFDDRTLKEWIVRGMRYLGRLPPKLKAKRGGTEVSGGARADAAPESGRKRSAAPGSGTKRGTGPASRGAGRGTGPASRGARRTAAEPASSKARRVSTPASESGRAVRKAAPKGRPQRVRGGRTAPSVAVGRGGSRAKASKRAKPPAAKKSRRTR